MSRRIPIFYSAILLTFVNLLLRLIGTAFQVYLSGRIGAAGIGLLQLVMSVGGLAVVAGIAGIRTATMYLCAEELGRKHPENISAALSSCLIYSFLCSISVAVTLYIAAPIISTHWIGDVRTTDAIRLFTAFLPTTCLCGVMTGYYTAASRIGMLSGIQVCEQLVSMIITVLALSAYGGSNPAMACLCILLGSGLGGCLTLILLIRARIREGCDFIPKRGYGRKITVIAMPLALADVLKAGIGTVENLMVPKRLLKNPFISDPLAAFGTISGMVFPILMFPACILYGLAELLIPELARCSAAGNRQRTGYLVSKSLRVAILYGAFLSGLMYLLGDNLCMRFYASAEAGYHLKHYALLIPMLYCDAITDAMTKGLGQQKICVRYNIITSALDVLLLYLLLPGYGLNGYFFSFLITHLLNFALSLRRLLRLTQQPLPLHIPVLILGALATAISLSTRVLHPFFRCGAFIAILASILVLTGILSRDDLVWFRGLSSLHRKKGSGLL